MSVYARPYPADLARRGGSLAASCLAGTLFAALAPLGSVQRLLLACALVDIPLQIDSNYAYLHEAAELGAVSGFNVSVTTIALALLYAGWLIGIAVNPHRSWRVPLGPILPLALYALCTALSLVVARDVGLYGRGLFLLVQMFLLGLYLVAWIRTWRDVRFVVACLLGGLVLESLIILGLGLAGEGFRVAGLTGRVDAYSEEFGPLARFGGTVGSPNNASAYLQMLLAPALAVLATGLGPLCRTLAVAGLGLGSVALLATQSRGGWLAALLSLGVVALSLGRGRAVSPAVPVALIVLVSALALFFHDDITRRLAGDDRGAARSRVPLMVTALDIIADDPLLGVGANNYAPALESHRSTFGSGFFYVVHNQYLLVWAETGLVGLAAFLWFLGTTLRNGWRRWKWGDRLLSPLALGFTAAVAGQMVHMHVDVFTSRPQLQLLVVVAVLISVMSRMEAPR